MRDPLSCPPEHATKEAIENKANDAQHASQATIVSASLTTIALFFESPILLTALLALLTLLLTSCWRNEKKRLEILKALPRKNNAQESSESFTPSTPSTPSSPSLMRRRAVSAPI